FRDAELEAINEERGIWKKSKYSNCFQISLNYEEEILTISNNCEPIKITNWIVKDESRKRYKFEDLSIGKINLHSAQGIDNKTDVFWNLNTNVWNNDADTVYLIDNENAIVLHN